MFELVRAATFGDASARGRAVIPADVPFLADHFPGAPVLPGTVLVELCAQIAGPLAERALAGKLGLERFAFLALVRNATFHERVSLPAVVDIAAELGRVESTNVFVTVRARCGETQVCRAELVMAMREAEAEWGDAIAQSRARVAAWQARAGELA